MPQFARGRSLIAIYIILYRQKIEIVTKFLKKLKFWFFRTFFSILTNFCIPRAYSVLQQLEQGGALLDFSPMPLSASPERKETSCSRRARECGIFFAIPLSARASFLFNLFASFAHFRITWRPYNAFLAFTALLRALSRARPARMSGLISADKDGRAGGISMGLKSAPRRRRRRRENESEKNGSIDGEEGFYRRTHTREKNSLRTEPPANHSSGFIFIWFWFLCHCFWGLPNWFLLKLI